MTFTEQVRMIFETLHVIEERAGERNRGNYQLRYASIVMLMSIVYIDSMLNGEPICWGPRVFPK
jgi:hypothetical protein